MLPHDTILRHPSTPDLTDHVFERLTVIAFAGYAPRPHSNKHDAMWLCRCLCGTIRSYRAGNLRQRKSKSCGCLNIEHAITSHTTHGLSRSPEYGSWTSMLQRCYNPNNIGYKTYGALGITVCERWRQSFAAFYADLGPRPSRRHRLERIKNNLGYSPDNCCWATEHEQHRNQSRNVWLTLNGVTQCLMDWAMQGHMSPTTLSRRLRQGLSLEEALTLAVKIGRPRWKNV